MSMEKGSSLVWTSRNNIRNGKFVLRLTVKLQFG